MPNWNYATIILKGDKISLDQIEDTGFELQKLRPMPKELYDDMNGENFGGRLWNKSDTTGTLEEWQTHCKTDKEKAEMKKHYEQHLIDFKMVCGWIDKYGVNGWHEWSAKYWGTKLTKDVSLRRISDTELKVDLTTAWALPLELLKFISNKYKVEMFGDSQNQDGMELIPFTLEN